MLGVSIERTQVPSTQIHNDDVHKGWFMWILPSRIVECDVGAQLSGKLKAPRESFEKRLSVGADVACAKRVY